MKRQTQKWLVILYSLIELDGGCERKRVLQHIQDNGYWCRNDQNDLSRSTRREKAWRNDFSYERIHLIEQGYMQKGTHGFWMITEEGRIGFYTLAKEAATLVESNENMLFTPQFYQKIFHTQLYPEVVADQLLLKQISDNDNLTNDSAILLTDGPLPKGPISNHAGNRNTYLRDPSVSRFALYNAGYRCAVNPEHASFIRRNSSNLYMEPHHLIPMSMTDYFNVNLDREQNIFSLCSNCHNHIHYGTKEDVQMLVLRLFQSRESAICSILGRTIAVEEIYRIYNAL